MIYITMDLKIVFVKVDRGAFCSTHGFCIFLTECPINFAPAISLLFCRSVLFLIFYELATKRVQNRSLKDCSLIQAIAITDHLSNTRKCLLPSTKIIFATFH